ncbi:peptidase G2 autoproteolytic cleavage domain-containing protein [Cohnella sp. JJ-181]|uniref:peptidase G2 autoproteolytic cleavage domain-containing protein n=1 Tax=Cohnella rhizoplanae TaxID=2974897 RepID=UPI0022FFAFA3|nr:peptidase G2 autoproteolytic cleavage domain-containing protein [Cohnella sp. JJ-181]CAI6083858.1 hypothetical protein COHCIP112018_04150 [Cohnella sp. JJ-181]
MALGPYAHEEGLSTSATGLASHAEGYLTLASNVAAHAEGSGTTASGYISHAEGSGSTAAGNSAHAEGTSTSASGDFSHAEGSLTVSSGTAAHAEGDSTHAGGAYSHAEGYLGTANGYTAHAEGYGSQASASASHAQGFQNVADAPVAHVEGLGTASGLLEGVHVMGRYGTANENTYSWYLANGTAANAQGHAAKILSNGNVKIDGTVSTPAADYAEMFESEDGKTIEPGCWVTLEGDKVRRANADDEFVLGIVSATPAVLADSGELRWKGKYKTDEWGRVQYEWRVRPPVVGADGQEALPGGQELVPVLDPAWDPDRTYVPRLNRPEWVPVGLVGKLLARDDGTCVPGGRCMPGEDGIATASDAGFIVLKRTGRRQILALLLGR